MIKFNSLKKETLKNFFGFFEAEKRFQMFIIDNDLVINYRNDYKRDQGKINQVDQQLEQMEETLAELEALYSSSDEEVRMIKLQIGNLENQLKFGSRERVPSKKILLELKENFNKEEVERLFAIYIRNLVKELTLQGKEISVGKIYRDFGVPMEFDGEVKQNDNPNEILNTLFKLKE